MFLVTSTALRTSNQLLAVVLIANQPVACQYFNDAVSADYRNRKATYYCFRYNLGDLCNLAY